MNVVAIVRGRPVVRIADKGEHEPLSDADALKLATGLLGGAVMSKLSWPVDGDGCEVEA